jgi:hypothetical protein
MDCKESQMRKIIVQLLCLMFAVSWCQAEQKSYQELRSEKMEKFLRASDDTMQTQSKKAKKRNKKKHVVQQEQENLYDEQYEDQVVVDEEPIPALYDVAEEEYLGSTVADENLQEFPDRYVLPAWPLYSMRFKKGDYFHSSITYKNASKMYDSLGSEQSVVSQKFGQKKVTFGQLFLASKLLKEGKLKTILSAAGDDKNPFHYLSDAEVFLDGHYDRVEGVIQYARQFWNNRFVVGISIPVVYQQNSLKYSLIGTTEINNKVANKDDLIHKNFHGDINEFFKHLLSLKGFVVDQEFQSKTGLGDVSCVAQWQVRDNDTSFVTLGARCLFPTTQNQDVSLLWAPELGSAGSPTFAGYFSALLLRNEVVSPYLHGQIAVSAPAHMLVRVPKLINFSGDKNNETEAKVKSEMIGFEYVGFKDKSSAYEPFSGYDGEVPAFADSFHRVKIAPGVAFDLTVGNVFRPAFAQGLTCDVFYNIHVKSMSSVQENGYEKGDWALERLVENSNVVDHHVGGQAAYQWSEYIRLSAKAGYSFAGRNNAAEVQAQVAFSVDF